MNEDRCTWQVDALYRLLLKYKSQVIMTSYCINRYSITINYKYLSFTEKNWTHRLVLETGE